MRPLGLSTLWGHSSLLAPWSPLDRLASSTVPHLRLGEPAALELQSRSGRTEHHHELGANIARFSVLTAIVMHAGFNTVTRFLNGLFVGIEPRANLSFEMVFPMSGLLVAGVLIVMTPGRLAYHGMPPRLRFRSRPNIGLQPTARREVLTRCG